VPLVQPADLKDMAKCCKNLAHFGAEGSAVKGYIAMLPLFSHGSDIYVSVARWSDGPANKDMRTHELQQSLADFVDVIVHEKSVFSLVFSTWQVRRSTASICF
jgi:hypothetical protein